MTDKQIEREVTEIVERLAIPWEEKDGELVEALVALCTRVRDEQREVDAAICDDDDVAARGLNPNERAYKEVKKCAAAIRNHKEQRNVKE